MRGLRNILFAILFSVASLGISAASDIYVAQNAAGGNTGADCADAHAATWFNTQASWGGAAGQIGPGTTVHLCGTFSAPAGASGFLTVRGSGSSGNPITLHFELGAIFTAPYWGSGGAIAANGGSYIVVDGVCTASDSKGRCTTTQGTITATLAGSPGATCPAGTCTYSSATNNGFALNLSASGSPCNNCEIKNLSISNLYIHTSSTNDGNGNNAIGMNGNNIAVDNNIIHDTCWAINTGFSPAGTTNISVFNNTIYNIDHGIAIGDNGNSTLSGLYIYGNLIHDFANWDTVSDVWHHDGIHVYANSTSAISPPMMIYNNYLYGNWGANDNTGIYLEVYANGSHMGPHYVFNNILAPSGGSCSNGGIGELNGASGTGMSFYNNTMAGAVSGACGIDIAYASTATAPNAVIENNIYAGNAANGELGLFDTVGGSTILTSNYNVWFQTYAGGSMRYNMEYNTLAQFTSATGIDRNSVTSNPSLDSSFQPASASPVLAAGANLYSTCHGQPVPGLGALCNDYAGNPRPSSGNWDLGAYSLSNGASPMAPPTGLAALVQ